VRDPRKHAAASKKALLKSQESSYPTRAVPPPPLPPGQEQQKRLPFEPSAQNQQTVGSVMASYALAGVGVTLGFGLVRFFLGF